MTFDILTLCVLYFLFYSLILFRSESLTDGWMRNHFDAVIVSEPYWISLHVYVYMSCLLRFDEIFFVTSFWVALFSLHLSFSVLLFFFLSVKQCCFALSSLLVVFLFLVRSKVVIILREEISKVDDRRASVKTYYR